MCASHRSRYAVVSIDRLVPRATLHLGSKRPALQSVRGFGHVIRPVLPRAHSLSRVSIDGCDLHLLEPVGVRQRQHMGLRDSARRGIRRDRRSGSEAARLRLGEGRRSDRGPNRRHRSSPTARWHRTCCPSSDRSEIRSGSRLEIPPTSRCVSSLIDRGNRSTGRLVENATLSKTHRASPRGGT